MHFPEKMLKFLNLKDAKFEDSLTGAEPRQYWDLEPDAWHGYDDLQSQTNRTRIAVEKFMVEGTRCPLQQPIRTSSMLLRKIDGKEYLSPRVTISSETNAPSAV